MFVQFLWIFFLCSTIVCGLFFAFFLGTITIAAVDISAIDRFQCLIITVASGYITKWAYGDLLIAWKDLRMLRLTRRR